jgi:hypothetical protein
MSARTIAAVALALLAATVALATPTPPALLRYEGRAEAVTPSGEVQRQPAGTEVGLCADDADVVLVYDVDSRTFRAPRPSVVEDVFRDGFEG